jgi:class 3 adenylate cyclase
MSRTVAEREPEPRGSQLGDAVLDAMREALRMLGGMVQRAAGITTLFAVATLKAAEAAADAAEAAEADEDEPEPRSQRPHAGGS